MTSPPARVPSARQVGKDTEFLTNLTEPSPIRTLAPPGCRLEGGTCIGMLAMFPGNPSPAQVWPLGGATWLYAVQHISPITQLIPWRRVSRVVVLGLRAWQFAKVPSMPVGTWLTVPDMTSESDRASESLVS